MIKEYFKMLSFYFAHVQTVFLLGQQHIIGIRYDIPRQQVRACLSCHYFVLMRQFQVLQQDVVRSVTANTAFIMQSWFRNVTVINLTCRIHVVVFVLKYMTSKIHAAYDHRFVMGNRTMSMHVIASSKTKRESTDLHKCKCMTQNYRTV